MRKLLLAALANALFSAAALAQQAVPLERVPEGRRVSGWAVDEIPLQNSMLRDSIEQYFGKRGPSTTSMRSDSIVISTAYPMASVHSGRAILKVDQGGEFVVVFSGARTSRGPLYNCSAAINLSGKRLLAGDFSDISEGPVFGNVNLTPGHYDIQYVIRCYGVKQFQYSIRMRGPDDTAPRQFRELEIFHVIK